MPTARRLRSPAPPSAPPGARRWRVAQWHKLRQGLAQAEPRIARAMLRIYKSVGNVPPAQWAKVQALLDQRRIAEAVNLFPWERVRSAAHPLTQELKGVFERQAAAVIPEMPLALRPLLPTIVNAEAGQFMARNGARLVVEITDRTRAELRDALTAMYRAGVPATQQVIDIKQMVGLHTKYTTAVIRRGEARLAAGWSVAETRADVLQYVEWLKNVRALTIARTEAAFAAAEGRHRMWRRMIEDNRIDRRVMVKTWLADPGSTHQACLDLDGEQVPLDQPFSAGVMQEPLHPNCVCTTLVRVKAGAAAKAA